MSKRWISISFGLALIISLIFSSTALAAEKTKTVTFGNRYGQVTAVSSSSITIENLNGVDKTILLTSTTKFWGVNGVKRSLSDVTSGAWIFASGTTSAGNLTANNIVLVGVKFTGKAFWNFPREFGTVISVDPTHGVFFMNTAMSGLVKVIVFDQTKFLSKNIKSVANISVGMKAVVAGPIQSNGFFLPQIVIAFKPGAKK